MVLFSRLLQVGWWLVFYGHFCPHGRINWPYYKLEINIGRCIVFHWEYVGSTSKQLHGFSVEILMLMQCGNHHVDSVWKSSHGSNVEIFTWIQLSNRTKFPHGNKFGLHVDSMLIFRVSHYDDYYYYYYYCCYL